MSVYYRAHAPGTLLAPEASVKESRAPGPAGGSGARGKVRRLEAFDVQQQDAVSRVPRPDVWVLQTGSRLRPRAAGSRPGAPGRSDDITRR
ncbi:hypothetical protein EYF80_041967 [Liparis tanakae]|uniref:Uncharacterized protein n=1 Tax=Liparis tanakae TaxID=230148 RepID=A0A4Z2G4V8_9TELE|nr:hypothetical protein EYF80_041967 [Liparis tanakae]